MGTNYYLAKPAHKCSECGEEHGGEREHIGKSSAGWAFSWRGYRDRGIASVADWRRHIAARVAEGWRIQNEYGDTETPESFWAWQEKRAKAPDLWKHSEKHPSPDDWLDAEGHSFGDYEFS